MILESQGGIMDIGNENNILFYNDEEGHIRVEVLLENEDVWLNVEAIAKLFGVQRPAITKHINNIYNDDELESLQLVPFWNKFKLKATEKLKEEKSIIT